jgi:hypothetical protein
MTAGAFVSESLHIYDAIEKRSGSGRESRVARKSTAKLFRNRASYATLMRFAPAL